MNFKFVVFGRPDGFDMFPMDTYIDLFQSFDDDSVEKSKMVIIRKGKLVYYSYLRYGLLSANAKEKAFIGISLIFNNVYCADMKSLYELFESVFKKIVDEGKFLKLNEKKTPVFLEKKLNEAQKEIGKIERLFKINIENQFKRDFLSLDDSFNYNPPLSDPRKYSLYEAKNVLIAVLREYTSIVISPEYEVRKIQYRYRSVFFYLVVVIFILLTSGFVAYKWILPSKVEPKTSEQIVKKTICSVKGKKYIIPFKFEDISTIDKIVSYTGDELNGLPEQKGFAIYDNGDTYEGSFTNGLKDGTGKYTFSSNGFYLIGTFKDNMPENAKMYSKKGDLLKELKNGKEIKNLSNEK